MNAPRLRWVPAPPFIGSAKLGTWQPANPLSTLTPKSDEEFAERAVCPRTAQYTASPARSPERSG